MTARWEPIGGCDSNPGTWDTGGTIIEVAARDGVIRRKRYGYATGAQVARLVARLVVVFTCDPRDDGGPWVPPGVTTYTTERAARCATRGKVAS